MKKYILSIAFVLTAWHANAQSKAVSFDVNGLKVILRPTQKETVSMSMFYRGGVMNAGANRAGLENLTLSALASAGTTHYSVNDYKELADEFGIDIAGAGSTDYGRVNMSCIDTYFEQGWKLFSDAITNPAFDATEFQSVKDKTISAIYQLRSDPETRIDQMAMETLFKGSAYSADPMGTAERLATFTPDSAKAYYKNVLLNKNKMFLVVAGNITREALEKKIKQAFAGLPAKPWSAPVYTAPVLSAETVRIEGRNIATNYISCIMNAPKMSSPDFPAFTVVVNVLSGNLHNELRNKLGLSYAPGASIEVQQIPYMSMFVSTTQPKKAYDAMLDVYSNIRAGQYGQRILDLIKRDHRSSYYRQQESSGAIVKSLGEAEVLGSFTLEEEMIEKFNNVTLEQMNAVFAKYVTGAIWLYLGDETTGKATFQSK